MYDIILINWEKLICMSSKVIPTYENSDDFPSKRDIEEMMSNMREGIVGYKTEQEEYSDKVEKCGGFLIEPLFHHGKSQRYPEGWTFSSILEEGKFEGAVFNDVVKTASKIYASDVSSIPVPNGCTMISEEEYKKIFLETFQKSLRKYRDSLIEERNNRVGKLFNEDLGYILVPFKISWNQFIQNFNVDQIVSDAFQKREEYDIDMDSMYEITENDYKVSLLNIIEKIRSERKSDFRLKVWSSSYRDYAYSVLSRKGNPKYDITAWEEFCLQNRYFHHDEDKLADIINNPNSLPEIIYWAEFEFYSSFFRLEFGFIKPKNISKLLSPYLSKISSDEIIASETIGFDKSDYEEACLTFLNYYVENEYENI